MTDQKQTKTTFITKKQKQKQNKQQTIGSRKKKFNVNITLVLFKI